MKNFNWLQQEIICRGQTNDACNTGLNLVRSTMNKVELLKAILRYWQWCFEDYEIIDDNFIIDNFTSEEIKESGIYLIKDKEAYKEQIKSFSLPTEGWEEVLLGGKILKIARTNLRDEEFAKCDYSGEFVSPTGEHHFDFDNSKLALEKAGHRTFSDDELVLMGDIINVWDDKNAGCWFRFNSPGGRHVHIFFPAAGFRLFNVDIIHFVGTIQLEGSAGYYWSSLVSSATNAYNLYFNSATVDTQDSSSRSFGYSVRCVTN